VHLRDVRNCYYLYEVEEARFPKQIIGPRVPLSWFEDLEDESLDDVEDCEPWLAADLRDHDGSRTEAEEVPGYMDLAVAGVIMGDLNAVFAVETAHRRQLLAARALRPSSMLVPGTPFPRSDVITDVYVDDAAFLTMAPLRADGSVADLPVEEVDRADAMYSALGMPLAEDKKVNAEDAELWGGRLRGRQGTLAFPGARRASLMAVTCVGLLLGLSKQQAQRVLGAWNFAMGFRSLSCSALGLVYTAVDRMPSRGRIRLCGPAQEDLLLAVGLAPLMLTNLRAQPSRVLFATDASPVAAGATMAPVPEHLWLQLYDWAEEKGEAVRLDWGSDPPPTELRDVRALSANVTCALDWSVVFSRAFIYPDHINVLELEAVILLIKRLSIDGWHHCRVLVAIDSRVVVGAIAKGRSSSRKLNFRLRKLAALLFLRDIYLEVIWVPTWANPADAPSRFKAMADWYRSIPTKIPTTLPGKLSREAAAEWENLAAPLTRAEADLRFTIDREIEKRPEYATQPLPISARWDEAWRSILLLMAGDVHPHPGPAAYRGGRGRSRERRAEPGDILITDILPVTRDHYERELGKFEEWLRVRDMAGLDALLSQGVAALVAQTVTYLRQMYADHVFSGAQVGLLVSGLKRFINIARALGAPVADPGLAMQPLWRIHRSWLLSIPAEFRAAIDFRFTLAIGLRAWKLGQRSLCLLFLIAFHCLLRPGEMVELRWEDLVLWDEMEAARFQGTYGFVRIRKPKTRRMTGHAPVQHVLVEDAGLAALLRWARGTIPRALLTKKLWSLPQHQMVLVFNRCCTALGIAHLPLVPAGFRGGGATDAWIRTRDVPGIRRRGRWTSERTLERYLQEGTAMHLRDSLHPDTRSTIDREAAVATELFVLVQQSPPSSPPPPLDG